MRSFLIHKGKGNYVSKNQVASRYLLTLSTKYNGSHQLRRPNNILSLLKKGKIESLRCPGGKYKYKSNFIPASSQLHSRILLLEIRNTPVTRMSLEFLLILSRIYISPKSLLKLTRGIISTTKCELNRL